MAIDNPKLQISDYQDCVRLVDRLGFDPFVYQPPSGLQVVPLEALNGYLRSTQWGMRRLFHLFESYKDRTISAMDVADGLRTYGIYTRQGSPEADAAFQELIDIMSTCKSGSMCASSSSTQHTHASEFLVALRNLRLAAIFLDGQLTGQDMCLNLHEYSETQLNSACPIEDPIAFLFKPASELFLNSHIKAHVFKIAGRTNHPLKWLHAHDASDKVILGLAVKYDLEPWYVEDVFTLSIEKPNAKLYTPYGPQCGMAANPAVAAPILNVSVSASPLSGCTTTLPNLMGAPSNNLSKRVFMVAPILRLSEHSRNTLRKYQAWRECGMPQTSAKSVPEDTDSMIKETLDATPRVEVIVEHCNLAMFVSGVAGGDRVISFSSKWRELMQFNKVRMIAEQRSAESYSWCRRLASYISARGSSAGDPMNATVIGSKHNGTRNTSSDPGSDTKNQIPMHNKELRTSLLSCGDGQTFLLMALRDMTEDYLPIADACKARLLIMQERIVKDKGNLCPSEVSRISESNEQLSQLNDIVGRVATIVETISSRNQWSGDAMSYLSEIRSKISSFLDDVSTCKKKAESIVEECKQSSQTKTRSFLDTITLVIAMFILVTFLKLLCELNFHL